MKKITLFVILLTVSVFGSVFAYDVNAHCGLGFYGTGYYLNENEGNLSEHLGTFSAVAESDVGTLLDEKVATAHTDYVHFSLGILDDSTYMLRCDLVQVTTLDYSRVPKNWYVPAYGDYFSVYINKSDNIYKKAVSKYEAKYSPYDWVITFKDDNGNIVAQDVLTGEMYDYFYERSFDEGNYFSSIELSVANAANPEWLYYYAIGLSDIKANAVPEPSSLLALAFGGAGTALAAYRRKQR